MTAPRDDMPPDRNLALELVRVTEAAALQAARFVGMGDKEAADQAAVDGMHAVLHTIHMDGVVVIGEGEKDEAPMLHNGEEVGDGSEPAVDIAVGLAAYDVRMVHALAKSSMWKYPVIGQVLTGTGLTLDQAARRLLDGETVPGLTPVQRRLVEEYAERA